MYLNRIVEHKKSDPMFLAHQRIDWKEQLTLHAPHPKRSLVQSLKKEQNGPRIIAEFKRASPSQGFFGYEGLLADQVRSYELGGASAISVLTEPSFFKGKLEDLADARKATELPILRKDFLLEPWEITQAKTWGADAVLLIAAILTPEHLVKMLTEAQRVDLDVLLEVHNHQELDEVLALPLSPQAVGINNRDLHTFKLDLATTAELAPRLPKDICRVSESGFATQQDLKRFKGTVDAFLIGESLMKSQNPRTLLSEWTKG